jgi:magnesium transporter
MLHRTLLFPGDGRPAVEAPDVRADDGWRWVDIEVGDDAVDDVPDVVTGFDLDPLAVRDAIAEYDLPKVDDFGHHLLVVMHGLRDDVVETYEVDCFLTDRALVTIHDAASPALEALWNQVQVSALLASGGPDDLLARLADVLTRRLLSVLDVFDDRVDDLIGMALDADVRLLEELTAVRRDLSAVRRVVQPQREVLDVLRQDSTELVGPTAMRRFSDVFDVANRAVQGLDAARAVLAETLDAYRGAEARRATDVTKVLTVYAAILLPLSLITGFFGMNFRNLPWLDTDAGWVAVTIALIVIAAVSLGVFVAAGWIRRPSGRAAGRKLSLGLIEAARAPAQIGGAVYEISTMPLRATIDHGRRHGGD